ncbi:hypothetical protein ACFLIM_45630 [Nonomuraea sp. M3C6]|uniref:Integrase core domain-containing protein n=1 Tax=Nonomuraea marmarensis TaxID=3351344 RepID=A0ABW7ASS6_9ACTN
MTIRHGRIDHHSVINGLATAYLQDVGSTAKFLVRDRDGKFSAAFDAVLADAGIRIIKSGVRMPRMNSIMERWIQTCRRELLDRTFDLEPAAPSARAARVRDLLQRPQATPLPSAGSSASTAFRFQH